MNNLIIPIAGQSKRYEDLGLKWKLKTKDGEMMLVKSILGIRNQYDRIHIIGLHEHLDSATRMEILNQFKKRDIVNINIITLDRPTRSQSETVCLFLEKERVEGEIAIKDCDNFFRILPNNFKNYIAVSNIELNKNIIKDNKSYVELEDQTIVNIEEKMQISKYFSIGLYGFEKAEIFRQYFRSIEKVYDKEIYISHIIKYMIKDNITFNYIYGSEYIDWGTKKDWLNFIKKY